MIRVIAYVVVLCLWLLGSLRVGYRDDCCWGLLGGFAYLKCKLSCSGKGVFSIVIEVDRSVCLVTLSSLFLVKSLVVYSKVG